MNVDQELSNGLWSNLYHQPFVLAEKGTIVNIEGVGENDTYNPMLCEYNGSKILAFRCEERLSRIDDTLHYHPSISFAKQTDGGWRLTSDIAPIQMMEDPMFMKATVNGRECVVLGGVRAKLLETGNFIANTELYRGDSLETLESNPFAVIEGMKDERLCQLPDGRFLLCRRPFDKNGMGQAVIHIIDSLDDLANINSIIPPAVAEIQGPYSDDWVGVNNMYIISDNNGTKWLGLLGHIGAHDKNDHKHYAATTYKIKLDDLLNGVKQVLVPTIIATRVNFEDGPRKDDKLSDIVFPGSLENLGDNRYRLWAGLSDARIGVIEISDPFKLEQ